ncbi:hypothetical protein [Nocardioides sp. InS609-2]|uniref:hypothetical protein n=1 Tax=Nocardioides sp. InS609-2 TaxID=2760705 RepID=UPI0020BE6F6F|nr:hypothetical protein [Nocardioides sp. InS609-2]
MDPLASTRCTRPQVVWPVAPGGGDLTWRRAGGPKFRQTSPGRCVPVAVTDDVVEQRVVEQGTRRFQGAVTGWAALRWQGAAYFDGTAHDGSRLPIPLISHSELRPDDRIVVTREQLALAERIQVAGLWCASPERAVFDEVRRRGFLRAGVEAIDMAAAAGLTTVAAVSHHIYMAGPKTGIELARRAVALAVDSSGSPPETSMRLVWELDAELPRPLCNVPLFGRGGTLLGFPDLFDPEAGIVGEYDGAAHLAAANRRKDVAREERFRDHGLEYFTLVAGDLGDRAGVVRRMLRARDRALFLPESNRAWTLETPAWWSVA